MPAWRERAHLGCGCASQPDHDLRRNFQDHQVAPSRRGRISDHDLYFARILSGTTSSRWLVATKAPPILRSRPYAACSAVAADKGFMPLQWSVYSGPALQPSDVPTEWDAAPCSMSELATIRCRLIQAYHGTRLASAGMPQSLIIGLLRLVFLARPLLLRGSNTE